MIALDDTVEIVTETEVKALRAYAVIEALEALGGTGEEPALRLVELLDSGERDPEVIGVALDEARKAGAFFARRAWEV